MRAGSVGALRSVEADDAEDDDEEEEDAAAVTVAAEEEGATMMVSLTSFVSEEDTASVEFSLNMKWKRGE